MDIDKIMELIDKVDASGISSLTVEEGCLKISIEKNKGQALIQEGSEIVAAPLKSAKKEVKEEKEEAAAYITSPLVGVFYSAPGPGEPPFVQVGDRVSKGQIVGIVEAMKLMNEIESDADGVIAEVLVSDAQSVEYGQSLFRIK